MNDRAPFRLDATLASVLEEGGLDWFVDRAGNFGVALPGASIRFHRVDLDAVPTLQARCSWGRRANLDHLEKLHAVLATLNFERPFPKAYARVLDDGSVAVVWESLLAGMPAPRAEIAAFVHAFVSRTVSQLRKLDALLPDPLGGVGAAGTALLADPAADASAQPLTAAPLAASLVDDVAAPTASPSPAALTAPASALDLGALASQLRAQQITVREHTGAIEVETQGLAVRVEAYPEVVRVCTALDASDWLEVAPAVINDWNQHMLAPAAGMDALGGGSEVSVELVFDSVAGLSEDCSRLAWAVHAVARGALALAAYGRESALS
ncbi:MAG: hypothetical protein Q3999_02120 [Buchananella hordeovulneris]|nr:hypothetical protein [Buchananella hordeovulneris]